MDFLKEGFEKGLNSLGENIGKFFSSLGSNLKDWFNNTIDSISKFSVSVGEWFSNLGKNLENWFSNLVLNLINLLSYINPLNENFFGYKIIDLFSNLFKLLFVPSEDIFSSLRDNINDKFAFIYQIKDMVSSLFNEFDYGDSVPSFNITYNNVELTIIDFSAFLKYRTFLHGIILAICWCTFIIRVFNRIPKIIGGV